MISTLRREKCLSSEEAKAEPGVLRRAELLLVSAHKAAMDDYIRCRWNPSLSEESNAARERSIVAMRRLGTFLKTRKIPADIEPLCYSSGRPVRRSSDQTA